MVEALAMVPAAELSLRLYLQCAEVFLAIYHISSSLVLCNSPLKFLGNLQEIILVSTILQAAGDCGLEPVAYEFFTQAFVLYEEEVSVSQEADPSHCDQCAPAVKTWHSMLIGYCCVGIAGFQSSSDCPTTHHRHIAKNTSIWS